jgi:23S rRNA (adenine2030-N6)-methyltransferase
MLSYQHAYHAGNPADIIKHALWAEVLAVLTTKPKPLNIYETHAGRGVYPLDTPETMKGAEYLDGLARLELKKIGGVYGEVVRALNPAGLTIIPGSPAVAAKALREGDALHLCELHPTERAKLHSWARGKAGVHCHDEDGYFQVPALIKAGQRDAVMIDPSYEVLEEYEAVVACVSKIIKRNPNACVVVWLPLLASGKSKGQHQRVIDALKAMKISASYLAQWKWGEKDTAYAMVGTAMVVLNLPFGLEKPLPALLQLLAAPLRISRTAQTYTLLVPRA